MIVALTLFTLVLLSARLQIFRCRNLRTNIFSLSTVTSRLALCLVLATVIVAPARTDRALGEFFKFLDAKIGKGGWIATVTADHGASRPPEEAKKLGLDGERVKKARLKAAVTAALDARFGKGEWIVALEDPSIYLNQKLVQERKLDPALVEETAGEALLSLPGFVGYVTRSSLVRGFMPPTAASVAIARSYFPARAGDVVAVQAPFSFWGKYGESDFGGSHGSFYRYDSDVPLFFYGAPFRPGYYGQTEMVNVAAMLARLLGISLPAACEGKPLVAILAPQSRMPSVTIAAAPHRVKSDSQKASPTK